MRRYFTGALATLLLLSGVSAGAAPPQKPALTVFAAASLSDVLQEIGAAYTKSSGVPVKFSFAASSALAKQIESGAGVDVFMSADQEWMDYLAGRKLIDNSSRRDVVANRLALVAPADSKGVLKIAPGFALRTALGRNRRLATGDPDSVPVGKYAKAALSTLGVWKEIEPRLVRAENVRAALAFVARGEVPFGIVYQTDAQADPKVRLVDLFPESSHAPITYPAAATATASPQGKAFVDFLFSAAARGTFERAGFQFLPGSVRP
ncbi:molybdate ABC transporter substrate-binding protein [Povalibacter sp.]|uniref:molybdate ABC transporter substrate-binding protein n=1 Tax=Povalibacter sp. TaxID=1962978 RepID=UPI002F3F1206